MQHLLLVLLSLVAPADRLCAPTDPPACATCSPSGCALTVGGRRVDLDPRGYGQGCIGAVCLTCVAHEADPTEESKAGAACLLAWPGGSCAAGWNEGAGWTGGCT